MKSIKVKRGTSIVPVIERFLVVTEAEDGTEEMGRVLVPKNGNDLRWDEAQFIAPAYGMFGTEQPHETVKLQLVAIVKAIVEMGLLQD